MILDSKSSEEYPGNVRVPQGSILGPTHFLLYINDLPDVICSMAICTDDTTLYSKCDRASDLWLLNLNLIYEIQWTGAGRGSISKTASKKIGALICSMKFLSAEVALYLYKFTIRPFTEYCCHVWAGAPS